MNRYRYKHSDLKVKNKPHRLCCHLPDAEMLKLNCQFSKLPLPPKSVMIG